MRTNTHSLTCTACNPQDSHVCGASPRPASVLAHTHHDPPPWSALLELGTHSRMDGKGHTHLPSPSYGRWGVITTFNVACTHLAVAHLMQLSFPNTSIPFFPHHIHPSSHSSTFALPIPSLHSHTSSLNTPSLHPPPLTCYCLKCLGLHRGHPSQPLQ